MGGGTSPVAPAVRAHRAAGVRVQVDSGAEVRGYWKIVVSNPSFSRSAMRSM